MSSKIFLNKSNVSKYPIPFTFEKILKQGQLIVKRIFDIIMSLIGLISIAPILFYISFLIKKDSPGPVFFRGLRMGKDGEPFRIIKLRTMYERPDTYKGPRITAQGDDRITPFGQWLRDTKINELPQLWNVFIGNMSFVGPRPEDVEIAKTWPEDASTEILSIKPGITSPASILYHDEYKMLSNSNVMGDYFKSILPNKMRLDRLYVRYRSLTSDIDTIIWTIAVLIPRIANYKIPEGYLFAGPISLLFNRYVNWFIKDLFVSMTVTFGVGILWQADGLAHFGVNQLMLFAFILTVLFNTINSIRGLNNILWSRSTVDDGFGLISSSFFTTTLVFAFYYLINAFWVLSPPQIPETMIYIIGFISGVGSIVIRYRFRILSSLASRWMNWRQPALKVGERVLLVGSEEGSQTAKWLLQHKYFRTAFTLVGMVDNDDPTKHGMLVNGLLRLGSRNDIPELIKKHNVGIIISTYSQNYNSTDIENLNKLSHDLNIRLIQVEDLLGMIALMDTKVYESGSDTSKLVKEKLEFAAMHDIVTKLPNRSLLLDRLNHSLAYGKRYQIQHAILFIELEGFRKFNEEVSTRMFHTEGIKMAAKRLEYVKRNSDTLARYGENGFVLVLEHIRGKEEVRIVVNRIIESLTKSFRYYRNEMVLSLNINVCMGSDLYNEKDMLENIDINYYFEKSRNINAFNDGEYNVGE